MDVKDAIPMLLAESAAHPEAVKLDQSAYDTLADSGSVPHWILSDMLGEVSGKGVLGALQQKYSAVACKAAHADLPGDRPPEPGPGPPAPRSRGRSAHQQHLPPQSPANHSSGFVISRLVS